MSLPHIPIAVAPRRLGNRDYKVRMPPSHVALVTPGTHGELYIKTLTGKIIAIECSVYDPVATIKNKIQDKEGIPPVQQRLLFAGKVLEDEHLLRNYNVGIGDRLDLVLELRGGKPVIYILSPRTLDDISVSLALAPGWSFSALYPNTAIIHKDRKEVVHWVVDASPDGTLLDKRSGLQVSYIFWEAE